MPADVARVERSRKRNRRRHLPWVVRYLIISGGGVGIAGLTFYGLKYLGY